MNPIIRSRLPPEYQILWELTKKQRLSGEIVNMVQKQIQQVRKNFRNVKNDPLEVKFLEFGNQGMWGANRIRELSKAVYKDKRPDAVSLGDWISVELELVMPSEKAETEFLHFVRKNGMSKFVTIKGDGSIRTISPTRNGEATRRNPLIANVDMPRSATAIVAMQNNADLAREQQQTRSAFGREIVITFRYGDWKFVKMICGELNRIRCFVNQSCGLHVHFDCRHIDANDVVRIGKRIAYTIPSLKQILPASRQNNRFCALDINDLEGNENRYSFVNLQAYTRHKTIEIRGHSGTTDAVKIINWIRILKTIMSKRSRNRVETVTELINSFKFEPDLIEYVNARFTKFHQPQPVAQEQAHLDDVEIDDTERATAPDAIINAVAADVPSATHPDAAPGIAMVHTVTDAPLYEVTVNNTNVDINTVMNAFRENNG